MLIFKENLVVDDKIAIFLGDNHVKSNLLSIFPLVNQIVALLSLLVVYAFHILSLEVLRTDVIIDELQEIRF